MLLSPFPVVLVVNHKRGMVEAQRPKRAKKKQDKHNTPGAKLRTSHTIESD